MYVKHKSFNKYYIFEILVVLCEFPAISCYLDPDLIHEVMKRIWFWYSQR